MCLAYSSTSDGKGTSDYKGLIPQSIIFYNICKLVIYLWLRRVFVAVRAFLTVVSGAYSPVVVCGLPFAVTSLAVEHGSRQ